jgi:hypothetical protein
MRGKLMASAIVAAAALAPAALSGPGVVKAAEPGACFFERDWTNWKAPDTHTIFINVSNRVWRLDLAGSCPTLDDPSAKLITRDVAGSGSVCSPQDIDLKVSVGDHIAIPCIVSHMTRLSPDEVTAIPPRYRP